MIKLREIHDYEFLEGKVSNRYLRIFRSDTVMGIKFSNYQHRKDLNPDFFAAFDENA